MARGTKNSLALLLPLLFAQNRRIAGFFPPCSVGATKLPRQQVPANSRANHHARPLQGIPMTPTVKAILDKYESDSPGVKANLARILMQGRLGGTGKLIILPVDQGFEHGPARSFAINPAAYDPHYHYQLAIDAGLSAQKGTYERQLLYFIRAAIF
eukprot:gene53216-72704_t